MPQVDRGRGRHLPRPLCCSRHGRGPPCDIPEGRAMRAGWWRSAWLAQGPQAERRPKNCFSLCSGCARQRIERRAWPPGDFNCGSQGLFECVRAGLRTWFFYIWGAGKAVSLLSDECHHWDWGFGSRVKTELNGNGPHGQTNSRPKYVPFQGSLCLRAAAAPQPGRAVPVCYIVIYMWYYYYYYYYYHFHYCKGGVKKRKREKKAVGASTHP